MPDELQRTPLYARHAESGGRLVPFAGWEMPVQYAGVIDEVHAVRTAAGLFDVSHMGQAFVAAADHETVARALETLVPADIVKLLIVVSPLMFKVAFVLRFTSSLKVPPLIFTVPGPVSASMAA